MLNKIDRSTERIKQTGEVFTPTPLVNEILDKLPPVVFIDPAKTFIDPSCGDGQFLVEVLKRKLENGHSPSEAAKSIYGVDLMPDNITHCKKRLLDIIRNHIRGGSPEYIDLAGNIKRSINNNIVCADSLEWDFENWQRSKTERQEEITNALLGDF